MLRKTLLIAVFGCAALPAQAQSLGDIRGHIEPYDNRSARFLNAYPQTDQQAYVAYQPATRVAASDYRAPSAYRSDPGFARREPEINRDYVPAVREMYDASAYPPPAQAQAAPRSTGSIADFLGTRAGFEFGLSIAGYHYQEPYVPPSPGTRVEIDGPRYGAQLAGTFTFRDPLHLDGDARWFLGAETRFSYASVDYKGSGTSDDKDDYLSESRLTLGHDFTAGEVGFSPFSGIGYRYLFNDLRGTSSTGAPGYRRQSQYVYVPFGLTMRADLLGNGTRVSVTAEGDFLLWGRQKSYIDDIALGDALNNKQTSGHGFKVSAAYETGNWSFGPYVNYWNIGRSDTQCNASLVCGFEPRNQTVEYGLKANYRFWSF